MVKREKNGLNKYIKQCVRDRARRRMLIALLAICAALVAGGVDPARIEKEIPFAGVLLKKDKDLQTLRKVK